MKTVVGTLLDATNTPIANQEVFCILVPTTGWYTKKQVSDGNAVRTVTSGTGQYSFNLVENDSMVPSGTAYLLRFTNEPASEVLFQVLASTVDGSSVFDNLIPTAPPPVGVNSVYVTYPAGDTRYAFKGDTSGGAGGPGGSGVAIYATMAARDLTAPAAFTPVGALCTTVLEQAIWQVNVIGGVNKWTPPWNVGWGRVAATSAGTIASISAAFTDVVSLAFTPLAGRTYRLYYETTLLQHLATGTVRTVVTNAANTILNEQQYTLAPEEKMSIYQYHEDISTTMSAGPYKFRVLTTAGLVDILAPTATFFAIMDIGPFTVYQP